MGGEPPAAAFATAVAVLPVGAVWLLSQGSHSYFYPRYLLFTAGAWAILAGIGISRIDVRVAAVAVLVIGVLGVGIQQAIRTPEGHTHLDYAGAANIIADSGRAGNAIIYPKGNCYRKMIGAGLQYYLQQDMPHGAPGVKDLFVTATFTRGTQVSLPGCRRPAAFLAISPGSGLSAAASRNTPSTTFRPVMRRCCGRFTVSPSSGTLTA